MIKMHREINEKKKCDQCNYIKDYSDFYYRSPTNLTPRNICKLCSHAKTRMWRTDNPEKHKNHSLKSMYGITLDDYNRMLEQQNGKCGICGRSPQISRW